MLKDTLAKLSPANLEEFSTVQLVNVFLENFLLLMIPGGAMLIMVTDLTRSNASCYGRV